MCGVMDAGATCGVGGVVGAAWGVAEVMGTVRSAAGCVEVADNEATRGQEVGSPASVPRVV
jgi:hypothetical protein